MSEEIKTVVILAGGKGTRMREETEFIPKPMVKIGGMPVLEHIINYFSKFKNFEFIICTGYKEEVIQDYFTEDKYHNVKILPTGLDTNTGGRIAKVKKYVQGDFIMTYGDGLADVNINKLVEFHQKHKKTATITVNKPVSRFGLVEFEKNGEVINFIEKPTLDSFVNIGYMVFTKQIFQYISEDVVFENKPLKSLAKNKEIYAYTHPGFFRPMDTYREYLELNAMWDSNKAPWRV
tara:strand:- start:3118 stop:3822 length:705 start_codon:yes stop_codon:yes gene_type:complete